MSSDRVLIFTDSNREKVAIKAGDTPKVGDRVVVFETSDGELITPGKQDFKVGDRVLVFDTPEGPLIIKSGESEGNISVKITDGFNRNVAYGGEIVNLGIFDFKWNGRGQIYIMSDPSASLDSDKIWADDTLRVSTEKGNVSQNFNSSFDLGLYRKLIYYGPALDITDILVHGINHIMIEIIDVHSWLIGCCSLHIVQVI